MASTSGETSGAVHSRRMVVKKATKRKQPPVEILPENLQCFKERKREFALCTVHEFVDLSFHNWFSEAIFFVLISIFSQSALQLRLIRHGATHV
jgi:hypothetical protein